MSDYYPESDKYCEPVCRNCEYYRPKIYTDSSEADYGECRRFPPTRIAQNESAFPIVIDDCWCGEYK